MNDRIDFLSPFRDKHRLDGRAYRDRIGRPYYGSALRRVLNPPPLSLMDRAVIYHSTHRWPAVVLLILGCALLGLAIVAATWQLR